MNVDNPTRGAPRADEFVLTPTRRLAHRLRIEFDADCEARGLAVWPTLAVLPWQAWLEQWFIRDRDAGRIDGRWVSAQLAALVWRRLIRGDHDASGLVSPEGLAHAAHRAWRRMHAYAIPASALDDDTSLETRCFARWAARYSRWLEDHRWVDPDLAIERLHADSAPRSIRVAGFDTLTPAQAALFERLRAAGVAVAGHPAPARRGDVTRITCEDARGELLAAARWAAERIDREPSVRLAIVVSDLASRRDEVRRVIERVLAPASGLTGGPVPGTESCEIAAAVPLATRPLAAAALELLHAASGAVDPASCSRLLRSPFIAGASEEAAARALLDAWLRRRGAPEPGLAWLARSAVEHGCPLLASAIETALRISRRWPRRAAPSLWSKEFSDLLTAFGWPGTGLTSAEYQTAERWRSLLSELASADEVTGSLLAADAVRLAVELAESVLFEPQEVEAPLTIIDPETCAGMTFDGLWLCGMESSVWPPPPAPDPFLPRPWQRRRELPDATAEIAARDAGRRFARLCRSADEVIASVAQFESDTPILPSALVLPLPERREVLRWPAETVAQRIHSARPPLEELTDGSMPAPTLDRVIRGGARPLELQSLCPFRAGAELRLGARPLEEPTSGIDPATRGNLAHRVLARLWRELRDQATLQQCDGAELAGRVRAAITAEIEPLLPRSGGLLRELLGIEASWLEARALELLEHDRARRPFSVASVEATATATLAGVTFALRLDRVDRLTDGSLAVIDYKTGGDADAGAWLGERPRAPQLPLYVQAIGAERVAAVAFGRVRAGETGYVGIARDSDAFGGIANFDRRAPKGMDSWEQLQAEWQRRLGVLAAEYGAGDARLAPDPARACRHCHLPALCRLHETTLRAELDGAVDE